MKGGTEKWEEARWSPPPRMDHSLGTAVVRGLGQGRRVSEAGRPWAGGTLDAPSPTLSTDLQSAVEKGLRQDD